MDRIQRSFIPVKRSDVSESPKEHASVAGDSQVVSDVSPTLGAMGGDNKESSRVFWCEAPIEQVSPDPSMVIGEQLYGTPQQDKFIDTEKETILSSQIRGVERCESQVSGSLSTQAEKEPSIREYPNVDEEVFSYFAELSLGDDIPKPRARLMAVSRAARQRSLSTSMTESTSSVSPSPGSAFLSLPIGTESETIGRLGTEQRNSPIVGMRPEMQAFLAQRSISSETSSTSSQQGQKPRKRLHDLSSDEECHPLPAYIDDKTLKESFTVAKRVKSDEVIASGTKKEPDSGDDKAI